MRIIILNFLCFILLINTSACSQHISVCQSVEKLFSLSDEEIFNMNENLLLNMESDFIEIDTLGIILRAPGIINSNEQEILPLLVAIRNSGERDWEYPIKKYCYIAATNLSSGTVIFNKLFYDRKEKKSFANEEEEVECPDGLDGTIAIVKMIDVQEVLDLSMTKGEWSFSIIYHDWVSNRVKVKIEGNEVHEIKKLREVQPPESEDQIYPYYTPNQEFPNLPENGLEFSCNYHKSAENNSLIFMGSFNVDARDYHFSDTKHQQFHDNQKRSAILPTTLLLLPENSEYYFKYDYCYPVYNISENLSRKTLQGYFVINVLAQFEDVTLPNDTYLAYVVIDGTLYGPKKFVVE